MALPEPARWIPIDPEKGYVVEEIEDGLHWVSDGPYQALFLVESEGVHACRCTTFSGRSAARGNP